MSNYVGVGKGFALLESTVRTFLEVRGQRRVFLHLYSTKSIPEETNNHPLASTAALEALSEDAITLPDAFGAISRRETTSGMPIA